MISFLSMDRHAEYTIDHDFKTAVQVHEWLLWELHRRSKERGNLSFVIKMFDAAGWGQGGRQTLLYADRRWYDHMIKRLTPLMSKCYCDHLRVSLNTRNS